MFNSAYFTKGDISAYTPSICEVIQQRIQDYEKAHDNRTLLTEETFLYSKYDEDERNLVPALPDYEDVGCAHKFHYGSTPEGHDFWANGFTYPSDFFNGFVESIEIDGQKYIL